MDVKVEKTVTFTVTMGLTQAMARYLREAMYNSDLECVESFQGLYNVLRKIQEGEI